MLLLVVVNKYIVFFLQHDTFDSQVHSAGTVAHWTFGFVESHVGESEEL